MRALRQIDFGAPADVVEVVETPDPEPGPGEVRIRVEAAAMHLADLKFVQGDPGFRFLGVPRWMGEEGLGRIEAVGPAVDRWRIGDRVFLPRTAGAFRDCLVTGGDGLLGAPEGDADQLALTMVNGLTAYLLLEEFCRPAPGDWLLQNGGNSSCGRFLVALARRKGVHTVSLVRRAEVIPELEALGADAVLVDSGDPDAMSARVAAATGGAPVHVGIDCVAGDATTVIARCLAPRGRVVNYGFMTGQPCHMAFQDLFGRRITLEGMDLLTERTAEELEAIYTELAALIGRGELRAAIAGVYSLDEFVEALAHQGRTGAARSGKIILHPNA